MCTLRNLKEVSWGFFPPFPVAPLVMCWILPLTGKTLEVVDVTVEKFLCTHLSVLSGLLLILTWLVTFFYENLLQSMYCVVLREIVCVLSMCFHSYKLFKIFQMTVFPPFYWFVCNEQLMSKGSVLPLALNAFFICIFRTGLIFFFLNLNCCPHESHSPNLCGTTYW